MFYSNLMGFFSIKWSEMILDDHEDWNQNNQISPPQLQNYHRITNENVSPVNLASTVSNSWTISSVQIHIRRNLEKKFRGLSLGSYVMIRKKIRFSIVGLFSKLFLMGLLEIHIYSHHLWSWSYKRSGFPLSVSWWSPSVLIILTTKSLWLTMDDWHTITMTVPVPTSLISTNKITRRPTDNGKH